MSIQLSLDQKKVLMMLIDWFKSKDKKPFITLGGFAGTGKTTLISVLRTDLNEINKNLKVAFCSYTGKASRVLKTKLNESKSTFPKDTIGTIHSLIYSPVTNAKGEITDWEIRKEIDADLIIIDEASMIDSKIWGDLQAYNIPIVAVGDHGQLPPIKGSFNLMQNPELRLEQIHRQARDNPIIKLSIDARESGKVAYGNYGYNIMKVDKTSADSREIIGELLRNYKKDTLILCGYNATRTKLNGFVRNQLEMESDEPVVRDRVICLRNNHKKGIFNGMMGTIKSIYPEDKDWYSARIEMDDDQILFEGLIYKPQFGNKESLNFTENRNLTMAGDLFDFGYAITVHKAQGSQAKRVVLFEERFGKMDDEMWRRWLYTGITRAEEELFIVG